MALSLEIRRNKIIITIIFFLYKNSSVYARTQSDSPAILVHDARNLHIIYSLKTYLKRVDRECFELKISTFFFYVLFCGGFF